MLNEPISKESHQIRILRPEFIVCKFAQGSWFALDILPFKIGLNHSIVAINKKIKLSMFF